VGEYADQLRAGPVSVRDAERLERDTTRRLPDLRAVFIAGDHMWEHALAWLLADAGVEIVARGRDVSRTSELVARHRPDVLLVDTSGGVEPERLLRALRDAGRMRPATAIVVVCARSDLELRDCAFAGGAATVADRDRPRDVLVRVAAATAACADGAAARPHLTRREVEILRLLADGRTCGEVAKILWLTEQTVKYHLARVYRKLGVRKRTDALAWARRTGIAVTTEPLDRSSARTAPVARSGW
jgi:DNA-binding NarL/FixJ family response regulator